MEDYQAAKDLLQGKVILITGASDGIGKTAAMHYAAHGATVILLGRSVKKLEQVYDDIVNQGYPQPAIYPLDLCLANPDQYQELAKRVEKEFSRLDGLLHNAAHLGNLTTIEHYDIKQWYTVLQTNLNARFLLTKACLPLLRKTEQASIVFTTSSIGRTGKAYWGAYSISKFGNEALVQILAEELENTSIRVNCINPGPTRTRLRTRAYPAEDIRKLTPPEQIMPLYLYLMGDDSIAIHGQSLDAQKTASHSGKKEQLITA